LCFMGRRWRAPGSQARSALAVVLHEEEAAGSWVSSAERARGSYFMGR
jgi:hypothetical protein